MRWELATDGPEALALAPCSAVAPRRQHGRPVAIGTAKLVSVQVMRLLGVGPGMMGWMGAPGDRQEARGASPLR